MSDLMLNVLATFAEFEREIIGERLRDARAALRSRGIRNAGRVPFGYSSDPLSHQLVVQPAEAPVVKRMQVAAEDIEQRVLAWLREPTGAISPQALTVLTSYAPLWEVLFPETVRRAVARLVWEVRWDGPKNDFTAVLDETAIAEAHASITRREEEARTGRSRIAESAHCLGRGERPKQRVRTCSRRLLRGTLLSVPPASVATYRKDPVYPRVACAVDGLLDRGTVVTPVDVLIGMGLLTREQLEDWRRGRVPYLERVINCNLTRLSRLLRILRFHAHDLNLKPSRAAYMRWGKGPKQRLRFTKTGDPKLEEAYATHFVWPGKGPFHPPASKESAR